MLHEKFAIIQKQMMLRLEEIRVTHHHSGNKGSNVEQVLRDFIRSYLPPYNRVGHGEVIDQSGANSRQLDVVITNQYHPFLSELDAPTLFFVEGVACAAEVKSVLTSDELDSALKNSLSFKKLKIKMQGGTTIWTNAEDRSRFVEKRPFFLFAFESQLSLPTIVTKIDEWNRGQALPLTEQIDAVFILKGGSLINFGTGNGALQFINLQGQSMTGYVFSDPTLDRPLVSLMSWLSASMLNFSLPHAPILDYLVKGVAPQN